MSVETWLVGELEECGAAARVYRRRLPEEADLPAFTYNRVATTPDYSHDGDTRVPTIRFQVDAWASDPDRADDLAEACYIRLSGQRVDGGSVFITGDGDDDNAESHTYRRILDVTITWAGATEGS